MGCNSLLPTHPLSGAQLAFFSPFLPPSTWAHLVDEGGELVIEGLDLLPLFRAHPLDLRVDLHVEGGQQALVDSDLLDATRRTDGPQRRPASPQAHVGPAAKAEASQCPPRRGPSSHADRDALAAPQVIEAPAPKATHAGATAGPPTTATVPGHSHRAETGAGPGATPTTG